MRSTIDAAGRVVIPKTFREELGLAGGAELEIALRDGRIEIEAAPTPMRIRGEGRDVYAVADRDMKPLNAEQVRAALERSRR